MHMCTMAVVNSSYEHAQVDGEQQQQRFPVESHDSQSTFSWDLVVLELSRPKLKSNLVICPYECMLLTPYC